MAQLLLVEDDVLLGQAVKSALEQDGHAVALAHNAAQAQKLWQAVRFDLCLLDIRLPDGSGLDLCAGFRQARDTPVIFLTANDADEDVVRGFQMGGDDYVTKPFAPEVLRQRVLAVLRRTGSGAQIIRYQELEIDLERQTVRRQGETIHLTATEWKLLERLARSRGRVLTRTMLLEQIWDVEVSFIDENTLSVHIRRLRQKLEPDPKNPPLEDTVLSRLQQQVERLASIWAGLNRQAKRERDEIQSLVSDLSHQLKTPVATLQIYGSLLVQPELSTEQRQEYGSRMQRALERLDFLLDSMVKLSRLESGSIRLQLRITEVEELVLNAALQVRRAAESKEINLSIQPPSKPIAVCCDPKWTEEAIFNILDNAVKYTPQGGQVALTLESYETYCRINISDTGCGIPPEEIPKIFQRFYRGQSVQAVEGVGLGLPLARKVVQEQGGWIKVSSDHKGSTFSIFLRRS